MEITLINGSTRPLPRLRMRRHGECAHIVKNAPDHYDGLRMYLHRPSAPEAYFAIDGELLPTGAWRITVPGGALPDEGETTYDLAGVVDGPAGESVVPIGSGAAEVSAPIAVGSSSQPVPVPVSGVVYDAQGAAHPIRAVRDDAGVWTTIVDDSSTQGE